MNWLTYLDSNKQTETCLNFPGDIIWVLYSTKAEGYVGLYFYLCVLKKIMKHRIPAKEKTQSECLNFTGNKDKKDISILCDIPDEVVLIGCDG